MKSAQWDFFVSAERLGLWGQGLALWRRGLAQRLIFDELEMVV
jgi:hypothetical protein